MNTDIWDDGWIGGYGTWIPLVLAVTACLVIWLVKTRHRKQKK